MTFPFLTSCAAATMSSAVVKLSVPISSDGPQRPQFLQRSAAFCTSLRVSLRLRASRVSYTPGGFAAALVVFLAAVFVFIAAMGAFLYVFSGRRKACESSQAPVQGQRTDR